MNFEMRIEKAERIDANELTTLTMRSKSHWNYSKSQISEWREDLTVTASYIERSEVYKLKDKDMIVGYYAFSALNEKEVELENLFVDPGFIGHGYGRWLMADFLQRIMESNFCKVRLDADPNAEGFYAYVGFHVVGQLQSSIEGRFLPIMELDVSQLDPRWLKPG